MALKIDKFASYKRQSVTIGNMEWSIPRLIELSRELPIKEMPLEHLNFGGMQPKIETASDWIGHIKSVLDADLSFPIILDHEGDVLDGRHRIAKALINGCDTIKFVRFETTPKPDRIRGD